MTKIFSKSSQNHARMIVKSMMHVLGLIYVILVVHALLCIAIVHFSSLALSFQATSMHCLGYLHDLASFGMIFQSLYLFHILMFITPSMCLRVAPLCLVCEPLHEPHFLAFQAIISVHFGYCFGLHKVCLGLVWPFEHCLACL